MLGLLFFFVCLAAGTYIVGLLPLSLSRGEWLAAGAVMGMVIMMWCTFLLVNIFGYTVGLISTAVLMVFAICLLYNKKHIQITSDETPKNGLKAVVYWGGLLSIASMLIYFIQTHYLQVKDTGWYSSGYTWGDIALHMSLASTFAHQAAPSLKFSLFEGSFLSYPFLIDFLTGMMVRLGTSWQLAFSIPAAVLFYAFITLAMTLLRGLVKSLRAAWLYIFIILFSGSAWGLFDYIRDASTQGLDVVKNVDYTNADSLNLHFANFLTSHLLPQRSYLAGIAVVMVILVFLMQWERTKRQSLLLVSAGIIATLPFIHVHSYFVAAGVWLLMVLSVLWKQSTLWKGALLGFLILCFGSAPQLVWQFVHSYHANFTYSQVGWMTPVGTSIWLFWIYNLGVGFFLMIGTPFMIKRHATNLIRVLILMGFALFLVGNLRIFQPNVWDNMKFFTYGYVFLMIPVAGWLASLTYKVITAIPVAACMVLLTGPGALALYREKTLSYQLLNAQDLALGDYINQHLPQDAMILTSDRHSNPVPLLSGRPIVMGYRGWLWSYGIDYTHQAKDVDDMAIGSTGADLLLKKYGVQYVIFQQDSGDSVWFNGYYYAKNYTLVDQVGSWLIFQIK